MLYERLVLEISVYPATDIRHCRRAFDDRTQARDR